MEELFENQDMPQKKAPIVKIVAASAACVALLLVLVVAVWWSIAGITNFDDGMAAISNLFNPTTATTTPVAPSQQPENNKVFENRDEVVATMGDAKLTNGQLQIYYWTSVIDFLKANYSYIYYLGIDLSTPFSEQPCYMSEYDTWQDFFLQDAWDDWHKYQAMALEAEKAGLELPEELQKTLNNLKTSIETVAAESGYAGADAFVQADYGPGCTFADYEAYMRVYFTGYNYFNEMIEAIEINDQILSDYYDAHAESLTEQGYKKDDSLVYGVRHILIEVGGTENSNGNLVSSEADWEACRKKAQEILDEWLAGEHTEATFAEFAKKYSADGGSNTAGGLYSNLDESTSFVTPFKDWYLDENNQVGAYGLVKTSYGYHIMYQSSIQIKWQAKCESMIYEDATAEILETVTKDHPIQINSSKVMIGDVDLTS